MDTEKEWSRKEVSEILKIDSSILSRMLSSLNIEAKGGARKVKQRVGRHEWRINYEGLCYIYLAWFLTASTGLSLTMATIMVDGMEYVAMSDTYNFKLCLGGEKFGHGQVFRSEIVKEINKYLTKYMMSLETTFQNRKENL